FINFLKGIFSSEVNNKLCDKSNIYFHLIHIHKYEIKEPASNQKRAIKKQKTFSAVFDSDNTS
ncbi:hypothetical protein NG273_003839, partial [Acinetobacter baumannii]